MKAQELGEWTDSRSDPNWTDDTTISFSCFTSSVVPSAHIFFSQFLWSFFDRFFHVSVKPLQTRQRHFKITFISEQKMINISTFQCKARILYIFTELIFTAEINYINKIKWQQCRGEACQTLDSSRHNDAHVSQFNFFFFYSFFLHPLNYPFLKLVWKYSQIKKMEIPAFKSSTRPSNKSVVRMRGVSEKAKWKPLYCEKCMWM